MKTKDGFSQFELLRLRWQSTALLLFKPVFKTICNNRRVKSRTTAKVVATGLVALNMMAGVALAQLAQDSWIGSTDSNWFLGKNWSRGQSPMPDYPAAVIGSASPNPTIVAAQPVAEAAQLIVQNNPSLSPGSLTIESTSILNVGSSQTPGVGGGSLTVGSTSTSPAGTMTVTGGGHVTDSAGFIAVNPGEVGTVTVSGANSTWTNSGNVNVGYNGAGTLTIENGGEVIDSSGIIGLAPSSSGNVTVSGPNAIWRNGGNLIVGRSGAGTLTIQNDGLVISSSTVFIANFPTATGTLNIGAPAGLPAVVPGTLNAPSIVFGNSNGTIVFNHTDTSGGYVFPENISGPGAVDVRSGTTVVTGNNTYSGPTTIQGGTFVAGTANAAQQVSTALGTGNVSLGEGTLSTTAYLYSVGSLTQPQKPLTINVGGNYTQDAGGTLQLAIGGLNGSQYDRVQVGGNASVAGNLVVSSLNGFHPSAGNEFEVLHAMGTRSGEFTFLDDSQFNDANIPRELRPTRVEGLAPNGILLIYLKPETPSEGGPAPGPPPIVEIPEPLPPVEPNEPLPPSFVLLAFDPTAEQLTSMFEIGFSEANTQRFKLDERFDEIQRGSIVSNPPPAPAPITTGKEIAPKQPVAPPPPPENRWGVWANGWGDWVSVSNDGFAKGYDFTTGGFIAGVDYRITDHIAVGLMGGYAHTATSLQPSGDVDVNTGRGGLYATYFDHGFYVNAAGYGGYNSYSTSRQALLGMANGSTNSGELSIWTEAGYDFHFGDFTVGPMGALQYTLVDVDGFTEQGSLLPLHIRSNQEASLRTDLGARATYTWHLGNVLVIPTLTVAWEHEYFYSDLPITVSSVDFPGQSATLYGPAEGHDSAIVNAGAGFQLTSRLSAYLGYQGQLGRGNYNANAVTGGFSFSF